MNDRFLFRAKRVDNGEWVIGNYQRQFDFIGNEEHYIFSAKSHNEWKCAEIEPSTICQCTGKRDEGKKLIFERDIIGFLDCTYTENGYSEHGCAGEVLWDDETLSFQVTERLSAESYEVIGGIDCKVIGNIFDNPELLEVER